MPITINGTTGIAGVDGSAASPAIEGSDTNTGIFFPAADTIAFTEGGAESMRIDSGGNLVIGNTTGLAKLDVGAVDNADEGGEIRLRGSTNATMDYFIDAYQSSLRFAKADKGAATNAAVRFQIGSAGQWGIGGATYGTSGQAMVSGGASAAPTWGFPDALSTASGAAPSYSARAWVNFNGTGTIAIRASGNVTSLTDNGVGDYTINFTTAMADANYAIMGAVFEGSGNQSRSFGGATGYSLAAGSARISTNSSAGFADYTVVAAAAFR